MTSIDARRFTGRDALTGLLAAALACVGVLTVSGVAHAQVPSAKSCAKGGACAIGDRGPGGGIVFLTPKSKGNATGMYFEAAPKGWNGTPDDPQLNWCDSATVTVSGTKAPIGAGAANTKLILAACASGAANAVAAYAGGGKSDWFLPSRKEMTAVYRNRKVVGGLNTNNPDSLDYWTSVFCPGGPGSPGATGPYAWGQGFDGSTECDATNYPQPVRPVRSFK